MRRGHARQPEVPFILSCMLAGQDESVAGEPIEHLLAPLPGEGPQPIAWGLNCGTGPDGLLGAVERAVRVIALPLVVQPNAGIPGKSSIAASTSARRNTSPNTPSGL